MSISQRNKKVAIARWSKVFEKERKIIKADSTAIRHKAAICGFLAGDGNIQIREGEGNYQVRFYPDDKLMLNEYLKAIDYVYGKRPSITIRDNVFHASITSRILTEDLTSLADFGLFKWNLPSELFSVDGTKEAWLRAFFSAEAYVASKCVKLQTINKAGMLKVSELLKELGIEHRYYEYKPKKVTHSQVSIIMILKKDARKLFLEKVGFWHSEKSKKLRKSLNL